jgi:cytochrome bd-type quinol oxidase subunit 2
VNPTFVSITVLVLLIIAILIGRQFRQLIPEKRVSEDTKDTVKLSMGLVATMAALLLGLLVSSAKGTYDAERTQVIQMAAKVSYLNRLLTLYGPETMDVRKQFHASIEDAIRRLWPKDEKLKADLRPNIEAGDSVYFKIEALSPATDAQQKLKVLVEAGAADLAQLRALLVAHSESSISTPMLVVVSSWLVVIFASFSLLAPPNKTAATALVISALAVAGAIFLLLELDSPFDGILKIPNREMMNALNQLPK